MGRRYFEEAGLVVVLAFVFVVVAFATVFLVATVVFFSASLAGAAFVSAAFTSFLSAALLASSAGFFGRLFGCNSFPDFVCFCLRLQLPNLPYRISPGLQHRCLELITKPVC